jgi:acyl-CoA thioester hydrolase
MNIKITNKTTVRVRYGETDQMGYVYYGNYTHYFEVGRVEAMRLLGMPYKELEELGVMLPVMNLNIEYKQPAKYDDLLTIQTEIVSLNGIRLLFHYTILKEEVILCTGSTTLVFVDKKTRRPTQPPKLFLELIEQAILNQGL